METLSLNGAWQVRQSATAAAAWLAATVPGCIHTDLLAAGVIPDPFYRDNEQQLLWVGEASWEYRRAFAVPAALLQHERVLLRCDGLDTLATIGLNGGELGRTDNMFRTWEFDVQALLRPGENEIAVHFQSAVRAGQKKLAQRYLHSWGTDTHKIPGGNYLRKAQCNFGWDWGPKLVTCGIWRDMALVAFDTARLADVHVRQHHAQSGRVTLTCQVAAERIAAVPLRAACRLTFAGEEIGRQVVVLEGATAAVTLDVREPQLWWPNGLGEQPLYTLSVTLRDEAGRLLDAWQKKIGLRTLRLVREPDEWGESFHFACNGVPFFAKGANWIPADVFIPRLSGEDYGRLLRAAAAAHMNMLRVWGGGIYEQPIFYELCDELGLCVWQDFMFACAAYPTFEDAFVENVAREAEENIRRLRHHACLALWCGNNELEQGLVGAEWTRWTMNWEDYGKVFDALLPGLVARLDPETSYWPASPHTPYGDRRHWNDPRWGDAHIWEVWHGMEPFTYYYTCFHRFNSEFGFQSFPEPRTVRTFTEPEDENITSYVMEVHQRSAGGNAKIMHYLLDWFRLPASFAMTLWLSQILQGMAIKHAVEHWRRTMPRGMGTLYWQLNDCWPVASWSSLDVAGRWKALHHMARRFYAPLLLSAVADAEEGTVSVHVSNDERQEVGGVMHWEVTTAQGRSVAGGQETAVFPANQNTALTALDLGATVERHGARNLLVWLALHVDGAPVSRNLALFARPKHMALADPAITWQVWPAAGGKSLVVLSAARPALWVWLEAEDGAVQFSDNFFHLRPGHDRTVSVTGGTMEADGEHPIAVHSLYDTFS